MFIAGSAGIGGGNRSLLTLASGLLRRGIASFIVSPDDGPLVKVARAAGLDCRVLAPHQPSWRAPWPTWVARRQWLRVLDHTRATVVHANGLGEARSISLAARSAGIPLISHVRWPPGKGFVEWAWRWVPAPRMFIFNSQNLLADHRRVFARICPNSLLEVVYNAVNLDEFPARPSYHRSQGGRLQVAIVANLVPVKGHEDFLQMASIVRRWGIAADFLIMGEEERDHDYSRRLRQYSRSLQLGDAVRFMGHVSDVGRALQEVDVVVIPSHVEPFGRSAIEAMACQIPVVATRVGGLPEVVIDGQTGLLVDKGSPQQLAKAVARLLEDHALRQRMGEAGRQRVQSVFDQDGHTRAIVDHYERALAGHAAQVPLAK